MGVAETESESAVGINAATVGDETHAVPGARSDTASSSGVDEASATQGAEYIASKAVSADTASGAIDKVRFANGVVAWPGSDLCAVSGDSNG